MSESRVRRLGVLIATILALPLPVRAENLLNCTTKEVRLIERPHEQVSATRNQHLSFRIDAAAKTVKLPDGTALIVKTFSTSSISAEHAGTTYAFNLQDHTISYAASMADGAVTTVIIGSGSCRE